MSRIGRAPIPLPEEVKVDIKGSHVTVRGAKGSLSREFHPDMEIALEEGRLLVHRPTDQRHHRALHGLTRALLNNMVIGVTRGFQKQLEVHGVGYRVELQNDGSLMMQLGFSHPVHITPPGGIQFEVEPRSKVITVSGMDKELVGQVSADIRAWRPPEPYKGKGIRYVGEYVRRKAGKAGKVA
ncbi:MAG: 50S ribosomal protein L6 [Chloroflexi bacterium]|nr:MAG: 50S ribosomal protein L6 [Chloroflexota bacterium]